MQKIGFIGLGNMGYPMAGHLVKNNYDVTVYNRSIEKSIKWRSEYNGRFIDNLDEIFSIIDVLILCVGNDDDIRNIVNRASKLLKSGSIIIDHTTTSATIAKESYLLLKEQNISFLDAPVSGGQLGAQNGKLTVMVGGDQTSYNNIQPLLSCYSKKITYMGNSGSGQLTKMANQICLVSVIQGLAEGINFAKRAGLNPSKVIEAISQGAAGSWQMDNRAATMIEGKFDFGFAVDLVCKDLCIALDEAALNGSEMPVTALIDQFYRRLVNHNMAKADASSLITLLH